LRSFAYPKCLTAKKVLAVLAVLTVLAVGSWSELGLQFGNLEFYSRLSRQAQPSVLKFYTAKTAKRLQQANILGK
jgi:hypothetical protein